MILKRYSTFVEDDRDEDEIWTSEDTVIQHAGAVEDGWDGILIEEETEDETEDEFEDTGSGIILQDYDLLANVLIDGFCPHHRCR